MYSQSDNVSWTDNITPAVNFSMCTEKKYAGNAEAIPEGKSPFPHPTFEHLVWLYCFVVPSAL